MNGHEVMLDAVRKRLDELSTREFIHKVVIKDVIREIEQFQMAVDAEKEPITQNLEEVLFDWRAMAKKGVRITWNLEDGE